MEPTPVDADDYPGVGQEHITSLEGFDIFISCRLQHSAFRRKQGEAYLEFAILAAHWSSRGLSFYQRLRLRVEPCFLGVQTLCQSIHRIVGLRQTVNNHVAAFTCGHSNAFSKIRGYHGFICF